MCKISLTIYLNWNKEISQEKRCGIQKAENSTPDRNGGIPRNPKDYTDGKFQVHICAAGMESSQLRLGLEDRILGEMLPGKEEYNQQKQWQMSW